MEKVFRDFQGDVLSIGDEVIFPTPQYRGLCKGKIIAFTPKQIRISYLNTWNYGNPGLEKTYLTSSQEVVKAK